MSLYVYRQINVAAHNTRIVLLLYYLRALDRLFLFPSQGSVLCPRRCWDIETVREIPFAGNPVYRKRDFLDNIPDMNGIINNIF